MGGARRMLCKILFEHSFADTLSVRLEEELSYRSRLRDASGLNIE